MAAAGWPGAHQQLSAEAQSGRPQGRRRPFLPVRPLNSGDEGGDAAWRAHANPVYAESPSGASSHWSDSSDASSVWSGGDEDSDEGSVAASLEAGGEVRSRSRRAPHALLGAGQRTCRAQASHSIRRRSLSVEAVSERGFTSDEEEDAQPRSSMQGPVVTPLSSLVSSGATALSGRDSSHPIAAASRTALEVRAASAEGGGKSGYRSQPAFQRVLAAAQHSSSRASPLMRIACPATAAAAAPTAAQHSSSRPSPQLRVACTAAAAGAAPTAPPRHLTGRPRSLKEAAELFRRRRLALRFLQVLRAEAARAAHLRKRAAAMGAASLLRRCMARWALATEVNAARVALFRHALNPRP